MRRRAVLGRSVLLAATVTLAACDAPSPSEALPHIVLITSDTLRADHLSVNGYARETSPNLDAFAARAWNFTEAITVIPKTGPSFATMFTGRHPQTHGVRSNLLAIPRALPLLAERLRKAGYRTAAFVGNPVLRESLGFARGFDTFELHVEADAVRAVNASFLAWSAQSWDEPSFVWLHYIDPHGPYTPPAEYESLFIDDEIARADERRVPFQTGRPPSGKPNKVLGALPAYQVSGTEDRSAVYVARYDAEIRYMDAAFGEVLAHLEERGLLRDSAVVFTADHGESLGEHDFWFEHGWFAYDPTLRVPLIAKRPGETEGRVVSGQVSNLDLLPTLLELAGLPADPNSAGASIFGPIEGRLEPVLIENSDRYPHKFLGLRDAAWKFLVEPAAAEGQEEYYDLTRDPGELNNLADRIPEPVRALFLETLRAARADAVGAQPGGLDDAALIERLKSLGYVD